MASMNQATMRNPATFVGSSTAMVGVVDTGGPDGGGGDVAVTVSIVAHGNEARR